MATVVTNKDYYYLSEVARMTETPESNLIHAASRYEFNLFVVFKSDIENVTVSPYTERPLSRVELIPVIFAGQLYRIDNFELGRLKASLLSSSDSEKCPSLFFDGSVKYKDIRKRIKWSDIVIKVDDVLRLVTEHQELNNDDESEQSYEELQAENETLKQRIAELEAIQAQATCKISPKSKAPIAATFKAIRTLAPELTIDSIERQTQLDGNTVSRSTIANYLSGNI